MKKILRFSTSLFMIAALASCAVISAGAAEQPTLPDCGNIKAYVIGNGNCATPDMSKLKDIIGNCNGNCDIKTITDRCAKAGIDINNLISKFGILPDDSQCTDCENGESSKPSVPEQSTAPSKPSTSEQSTQPSEPSKDGNTDAQKPSADSSISEYEKQVVEIVNRYRAENGLKPLTLNTELSKVARLKSQDMKDKKYFSHTSPTYGSPFDMMKKFGISYRTAGENIAMGQRTPEAVMTAWMNSSGHRANILNSTYTQIGVGYVADGNYWTQMFIS